MAGNQDSTAEYEPFYTRQKIDKKRQNLGNKLTENVKNTLM